MKRKRTLFAIGSTNLGHDLRRLDTPNSLGFRHHVRVTADITVDSSRALGAAVGGVSSGRTYTVKSGDTLSKISKELYGDSNEYLGIFFANRDKLKDPDMVQVGQQLTIPAKS